MKKSIISIVALLFCVNNFAQIKPAIVRPQKNAAVVNPPSRQINNTERISTIIDYKTVDYFQNLSKLNFAYLLSDPDCHTCTSWEYLNAKTNELYPNQVAKKWKEPFMWRKIPAGAVFGRYEVSSFPFSKVNTAIIKTGIIETKGLDSAFFEIDYNDVAQLPTVRRATTIPTNQTQIKTREGGRPEKATSTIQLNKTPLSFLTNFLDEYEQKYYIRIIPLDANKNEMPKKSNEIILSTHLAKPFPKPPKEQPSIYHDYTITAIKYIPVHFPDPNYYSCTIVSSYNKKSDPNNANSNPFAFSDNDIFGMNNDNFEAYFEKAFPIGTTLCPKPPKQKAWYEKAFDGATGFITKTYDGAANFYNETKTYLKDKFKELNCNANLATNVINPVTKLQEAAGPEVCELISNAAFDYGMAVVGIPPSMPTSDEFTALAEGQIVALACDKIESETGVPVPNDVREKIQKEFHDKITKQSNAGVVNAGPFNVKPHPNGQFKTAYLEIEVTRTSNSFKGKAIAGIGIDNKAERADVACENCYSIDNNKKNLSYNLFEHAFTQVPFLENVGDKMKLIVVLKPQESWLTYNKQTGKIKYISYSPPINEYYTPVPPTYEGATLSPGFSMLNTKSSIAFSFGGMNIANGVNLIFNHQ